MAIAGIIKLFNKHELLLEREEYRGRYNRRDIFTEWEKKYMGEDFNEMLIHVQPNSNIGNIRKDGMNRGATKDD